MAGEVKRAVGSRRASAGGAEIFDFLGDAVSLGLVVVLILEAGQDSS